jgi:hypothetical protein
MLDSLVGAVVEAVVNVDPVAPKPTTSDSREWAVQRPNRGMVGRYMDSNVPAVWKGVPTEVRRFLSCVAAHESSHSRYARNPSSTASGKYQFLDSTWRGIAKWTKVDGEHVARPYARAYQAPAWIQEAVAVHSVLDGGWSNWNGTRCGHGT